MNKYFTKHNLSFIVPVAIWLLFYGLLLINTGSFTMLWVKASLLGAAPYITLWLIAALIPKVTKLCQIGSIAIFSITTFLVIKYIFFTHNSEQAAGIFFLPFFIAGSMLYIIPVLLMAALIIYLRRLRPDKK